MLVERYVRKLLAKKAEGNTSSDVVSEIVAAEGVVATAAFFRHCRGNSHQGKKRLWSSDRADFKRNAYKAKMPRRMLQIPTWELVRRLASESASFKPLFPLMATWKNYIRVW